MLTMSMLESNQFQIQIVREPCPSTRISTEKYAQLSLGNAGCWPGQPKAAIAAHDHAEGGAYAGLRMMHVIKSAGRQANTHYSH